MISLSDAKFDYIVQLLGCAVEGVYDVSQHNVNAHLHWAFFNIPIVFNRAQSAHKQSHRSKAGYYPKLP